MTNPPTKAERLARIAELGREIRVDALCDVAARLGLAFYDDAAWPKILEALNAILYDYQKEGAAQRDASTTFEKFTAGVWVGTQPPARK